MKKLLLIAGLLLSGSAVFSQFSHATLQASGLTCSMCSKAVKKALDEVPFVSKVMVDIKTQEYKISFRDSSSVDFDALSKAVEDAGFAVASLKVTAMMEARKVSKDEHLKIGNQYFHFLNAGGGTTDGPVTFSMVDKGFVSAKQYKKYSSMSARECVKTGKAAACCEKTQAPAESRIYHVLL